MPEEEEGLLNQAEIEALLGPAKTPGDVPEPPTTGGQGKERAESVQSLFQVTPFTLEELGEAKRPDTPPSDISLLADVDLNVRVELGRTRMYIEEVLKLREGSIVPLEKLAGDPVDIFVNGQLLARGEVLVLNDNFCVRVSEVVGEKSAQEHAEAS